jgi:pimeloyl-ACP methyl ester carboxylesterase
MRYATRVFLCFLIAIAAKASAPQETSPTIVIGFVGGMIRHDDRKHSEVQLAENLRRDFPSGVYVAVFENRRREAARREILRRVGSHRKDARIILYGHSWGAAAVVTLARELERDGIAVRLTVQVDSIRKFGQDDSVIPSNVAEAANFYQPRGMLRGRRMIRAADPERTHILGNFRIDYRGSSIQCAEYPWHARVFAKPHIQIECDPSVWNRVEALIRSKL